MELAKIVIGIIHTINDKEGTAQCILPEYDGRKTSYLQFLFPLTKNDKEYKIPEIDTPVVCLFIGEDDRGFILGTFYTEVNQTPQTASREKIILHYPGGGSITLNKKTGILDMEIIKEINITSPKINLKGDLNVSGETTLAKNLNVKGSTFTGIDTFTEVNTAGRKL